MHRIGFLISDGFQIMALAAQSVFAYSNTDCAASAMIWKPSLIKKPFR